MQHCAKASPGLPHLSFLPILPSSNTAAPYFSPFHSPPLQSALPGSRWWQTGWMGSTGLLHKEAKWASESGCWLIHDSIHPPPVYSRLFLNLCLILISVVHQISWWLSLAHFLSTANHLISFINPSRWFLWGFWMENHLILYSNVWK